MLGSEGLPPPPRGSEVESGGWMCISLVTDGGQRLLTDISEETTIQILCSCFSEAAFLAQISESSLSHVYFDLSMVKYFLLLMRSKKMKILANFMFSHRREPRRLFSQEAVGASSPRSMWGARPRGGCGHVAGHPKPYPAVLELPTSPATEEKGWPRRVKGTRGQPGGQRGWPRCRREAARVLGSREVEKLPTAHTAMRGSAGVGAAARRGRSPARGGGWGAGRVAEGGRGA